MEPQRIGVKFFVEGASLDGSAIVPVFHRWIQQGLTADTLVDVADYKHVHEGPHAVLVAHEADYIVDLAESRPGLRYIRKRWGLRGSLRDRLGATVHGAAVGAKTLADDPQPHEPISFRTDRVQISFYDRLATPNTEESFETVRPAVEALAGDLYGGADVNLERGGDDPRLPLTIEVVAAESPSLDVLAERTQAAASSAG